MSELDFSVTCPYCGAKDDPSNGDYDLYWCHQGYFTMEDGDDKMDVECLKCGKTYTYSCEILGVKPKAEKLYDDEEEVPNA